MLRARARARVCVCVRARACMRVYACSYVRFQMPTICLTEPDNDTSYVDCMVYFALGAIEALCVVVFTVEYGARLATTPDYRKFFFNFFDIIDLLSILPFYVEVLALCIGPGVHGLPASPSLIVIICVRCTLARVFLPQTGIEPYVQCSAYHLNSLLKLLDVGTRI